MTCPELMRVQACFDGEANAVEALAMEQHVAGCAECASMRDQFLAVRLALRQDATYYRVDKALRRQLGRALDTDDPAKTAWRHGFSRIAWSTRQFWTGAASGALVTGAAAALAFFLAMPLSSSALVNDALSAHLRSLMANRLVDVISSNHHTVKPWFAGHADVSPAVAEFSHEGYSLVGGRVDYLDGERAAVVVYRHGAHIINVFAWPYRGETLPSATTRNGYHLVFWHAGNLAYCAISDTALDELIGLTRLLKTMAIPDSRE